MWEYNTYRLFKRILWKLFPKSEKECLEIVKQYVNSKQYPNIAGIDETIETLISKQCSIARYGDGEFTLCFGRNIGFQNADNILQKRLREILKSNSEHCLVALPECKLEDISPFWIRYWFENFKDIVSLLHSQTKYYNQSISREFSIEQLNTLKQLWTNRFVVFVFGKGSRFNCSHEIFTDIKGHSIVYGLPQHAWSEYSKLLNEVKQEASKHNNPLILISLGPTATVLAFDLCMNGNQAIDIGHITNVYDRLVYGAAKPEELPIKY